MKNNIENIPNEIFDWMVSLPFEALSADMKRSVLPYLTKEEYSELYDSNLNIKNALHANKAVHSQKADLLALFDEKHQGQNQLLKLNSAVLWKAASVLFLISTLWFAIKKSGNVIVSDPVTIVKNDTVFVERETAALNQKTDTIYIEKTVEKLMAQRQKEVVKESKNARAIESNNIPDKVYAAVPDANNDFEILPVSTMNNISNTTKRNSMNDDSLEKNFKFVSM